MSITTGVAETPDAQKLRMEALLLKHQELFSVDVALDAEAQDRHSRYLYLVMALVDHFWNGNRRGVTGNYNYRTSQQTGSVWSDGKEYLGHNIAAIAVDKQGDVIDFDFNHNEIFKSSVEHAEARLLRRLFSLTGLRASWSQRLGDNYDSSEARPDDPKSISKKKERYSTTLSNITIYTSLEPCAQCAGMMALGRVGEVVYLQDDPGAGSVVNILYNLKPYGAAAKPIPAKACRVTLGTELNDEYEKYKKLVSDPNEKAFYIPQGKNAKEDRSTSLTTFLCTDMARDVYAKGAREFLKVSAKEQGQGYGEGRTKVLEIGSRSLTDFFEYARIGGHRGTPH